MLRGFRSMGATDGKIMNSTWRANGVRVCGTHLSETAKRWGSLIRGAARVSRSRGSVLISDTVGLSG
jgi:hypothetical protein